MSMWLPSRLRANIGASTLVRASPHHIDVSRACLLTPLMSVIASNGRVRLTSFGADIVRRSNSTGSLPTENYSHGQGSVDRLTCPVTASWHARKMINLQGENPGLSWRFTKDGSSSTVHAHLFYHLCAPESRRLDVRTGLPISSSGGSTLGPEADSGTQNQDGTSDNMLHCINNRRALRWWKRLMARGRCHQNKWARGVQHR